MRAYRRLRTPQSRSHGFGGLRAVGPVLCVSIRGRLSSQQMRRATGRVCGSPAESAEPGVVDAELMGDLVDDGAADLIETILDFSGGTA